MVDMDSKLVIFRHSAMAAIIACVLRWELNRGLRDHHLRVLTTRPPPELLHAYSDKEDTLQLLGLQCIEEENRFTPT